MDKNYTAKYGDYLISLTGACLVAFGLGTVVGDSLGNLGWVLVILGAGLHPLGMFRSKSTHH
jgi:hypothetical protein